MADHQMRSVFAQLLQGQAEIKQQLADLQRQCSQVGRRGEGRGRRRGRRRQRRRGSMAAGKIYYV